MKLTDLVFERGHYLAFVLDEPSRQRLLSAVKPSFERVLCHHVTIIFRMSDAALKTAKEQIGDVADVEAFGYYVGEHVDCFAVKINGSDERPDGQRYHVTLSTALDKKPALSNELMKDKSKFVPLKHPITLTGKFDLQAR